MNPITIYGDTYTSITAAWRGTGKNIPLVTARWRLRNGWTPEDAFFYPVVIPQDRRKFKEVRLNIDDLTM